MFSVVLIRPGCTDFDDQHRIQGNLDLPLNPKGEDEVCRLAVDLRTEPIEILYTSPCEPARSTAARLGRELNLPVKELEGLQNLDQGLWQGLCLDQIRQKHPRVYKQWQEAPESVCPPGGETVSDALERLQTALQKPLKRQISFGVVVPEPIASILASWLTGRRLDLAAAVNRCAPQWEKLQNGTLALMESHRPAG